MRDNTHTRSQSAVLMDKTNNLEVAACLATLGFEVKDFMRIKSDDITAARNQPEGVCYWTFSTVSEDGKYTLEQVLAAWKNEAWLTDPNNTDPLAHIIVAFRNRARMLDWVKQSAPMVAIKSGERWALVPENAGQGVRQQARNFLIN